MGPIVPATGKWWRLGNIFGLEVSVAPGAVAAWLLVAGAAVLAAAWLRSLAPGTAFWAGVSAASLLFASEFFHQLGHALAARRTGYPMQGVHYFGLFAASVYPAGEPPPPGRVHAWRALGGFWVNLLLGAALLPLARYLWPISPVWGFVAAFGVFVNGVVLGLGALVPLRLPGGGLTDGGMLLALWRARRTG
jgi:hypothetical protein